MSEVAAIARLLADPDPGVATALRRQLAARAQDPSGLKEEIEALDDPADRGRAREARLEIGRERAAENLVRLSQLGFEPDLEVGALEIARLDDPDKDCEPARAKLEDLGRRAREALGTSSLDGLEGRPRPSPSRERLAGLARFLGNGEGFAGDAADDDVPRCSSLPDVLERKRGLPIALSVVYLLVAQRSGVELFGVGAPLHFLVGGPTEKGPLYLDPFGKGRLMEAEDVAAMLRGLAVSFRPEHLAPTPVRHILARMARNLVAFHARRPRGEVRARRYARVAMSMEESS